MLEVSHPTLRTTKFFDSVPSTDAFKSLVANSLVTVLVISVGSSNLGDHIMNGKLMGSAVERAMPAARRSGS
jgi:hypothetical protein